MDITVYLPEQLGRKAKAAGLNFSRLLRTAVEEEIDSMEALQKHENQMTEISLSLADDDHGYVGTFTGVKLASVAETDVYLTDDERVLLYDEALESLESFDDLNDPSFQEHVGSLFDSNKHDRKDYIELMNKLGLKARVEI